MVFAVEGVEHEPVDDRGLAYGLVPKEDQLVLGERVDDRALRLLKIHCTRKKLEGKEEKRLV